MIYSVDDTVNWLELGYFSTFKYFLVSKSFSGSFWDSYSSKIVKDSFVKVISTHLTSRSKS